MSGTIQGFLQTTVGTHEGIWDSDTIRAVSRLMVPDRIYGGREELLRGDIHFVWARWFVESICDPARFVHRENGRYGQIFFVVFKQLQAMLGDLPKDELRVFASSMAQLLSSEVDRRLSKGRDLISLDERWRLIEQQTSHPRCWVCGYEFSEAAQRLFLKERVEAALAPLLFVDCMTARGKTARDLSIEVDHVLPVAAGGGGGENLRLACGWCNRNKSDNLSLYDQAFAPQRVRHPALGIISTPRAFWVVRLLAFRGRCESPAGCDRTVKNSELMVAARNPEGAMNPANLIVVCPEHDPLGLNRLVSPQRIERLD